MFAREDDDLLEAPAFAKLATLMPDGAPQNTVMWFRREGGTLRMIAPAAARKARNLARDPRVSIVIDDPRNGYRYLDIRGRATVVLDDGQAREELRRIAARYIGASADAYVDSLSADARVLIVIHPESVRRHHGNPPGSR
jgi:PPOX class probable F420-dependent enzyme